MKDFADKIVESGFIPTKEVEITKEDLVSAELLTYVFSIEDEILRQGLLTKLQIKAIELNIKKPFDDLCKAYSKKYLDEKDSVDKKEKSEEKENNNVKFTNCPLKDLSCGEWNASDEGIWKMEKRGFNLIKVNACPHPLLPVARLKNVETGMENVELSFNKDGTWENIVLDKNIIANKAAIINIANRGIDVNSNNASALISYISDMMTLNKKAIPVVKSINRVGWIDNKFVPYTECYEYDGDIDFKDVYESLKPKGNYEKWKSFIKEAREYNTLIKILMATSFAAPLVKLTRTLPFILHLWGGTGVGKTVGLKIAMSIWGEPADGKLVKSLNSTQVAMNRYAAFMHSLPVAFDELQTIKNKFDSYDEIIMQLTEGMDRSRGKANGGVQSQSTWRTAFLFSGEEPITKENSGGGAKNRVLEMEAKKKLVSDGNYAVNIVEDNYGFAGRDFILNLPSVEDIKENFFNIKAEILSRINLTEKQANSVALILLGDKLSNRIFEDELLTIDDIIKYLPKESKVDLAERTYGRIVDWISQNTNRFTSSENGEIWGRIDKSTNECFVNKSILMDMLEKNKINFDGIKSKLCEAGYISKNSQGKYCNRTRIFGIMTNCIKINIPELTFEEEEELNDIWKG